jgi:hypothetical protein
VVKRGVGNTGWTDDHKPLGIDISMTVTPLDTVINVPIDMSSDIFAADNAFTDYVAVLSSMTLDQQYFMGNRFKVNLARKMASMNRYTSSDYWSSMAHESMLGHIAAAFAPTEENVAYIVGQR